MIHAFFYGIILAFGLIIPLGAQNTFVLNQGASQRKLVHALPSALAAFICDFILIISAVLGASIIILAIPFLKKLLLIVGILFLIYIGWLTWNNQDHLNSNIQPLTIKAQIIFAVSVSLLNPHALLDTMAVIGPNSIQFSMQEKYAFMLGCGFVSLTWFLFLSLCGSFIKKIDLTGSLITYLNKLSALIIWVIAYYLSTSL